MARKDIGVGLNRDNRNAINHNFIELYKGQSDYSAKLNQVEQNMSDKMDNFIEDTSNVAVDKVIGNVNTVVNNVIDNAKLNWINPVDSYGELPTDAEKGDTVMTREDGKVYRFDGDEWVEIQQIDAGPVNELDSRLSQQLDSTNQQLAETAYYAKSTFGAIGDGIADDSIALRQAFMSGYKVILSEGTYLMKTPMDIDGVYSYFDIAPNTEIVAVGDVTIIFDNPTKGVRTPYACRVVNKKNIKIKGVKWQGHVVEGTKPNSHRVWGMGFYGCDNLTIKGNTFSTFEGHNIHINRNYDIDDWIKNGEKNSVESVKALMATSSQIVRVKDNKFIHPGSSCMAAFGVNDLVVDQNNFDVTGGLSEDAFFTDDASSGTSLGNYAVNTNIKVINNTTNGVLNLSGSASGLVAGNTAKRVNYTSYDFDQQKVNFGDIEPSPFMWMNYLKRSINIKDNILNKVTLKAGSSVVFESNTLTSEIDSDVLSVLSNNGILWGNGVNYYDTIGEVNGRSGKIALNNNTYVAKHANVTANTYGTPNANQDYLFLGNKFILEGGSFLYYDRSPSNSRKLSERYIQDESDSYIFRKETDLVQVFNNDITALTNYLDSSKNFLKMYKSFRTSGSTQNVNLLKIDATKLTSTQSSSIFIRLTGNRALTGNGLSTEYDIELYFGDQGVIPPVVTIVKRPYGGSREITFNVVMDEKNFITISATLPNFSMGFAEISYSGSGHPAYKI